MTKAPVLNSRGPTENTGASEAIRLYLGDGKEVNTT